jgi:F0F1-type ATP synthase membrane subunit b/b'
MGAEEALKVADETQADDNGIGARVNAVFTAAEKAAQHMLEMAREEGDDIRRQARAEADALAKQLRLEAEREVERMLADARVQGDAIKAAAQAEADKVEDDARIRRARLREEMRLIEERIAWAHQGLQEVKVRLADPGLELEDAAPAS